jgi:hypothetical protein
MARYSREREAACKTIESVMITGFESPLRLQRPEANRIGQLPWGRQCVRLVPGRLSTMLTLWTCPRCVLAPSALGSSVPLTWAHLGPGGSIPGPAR